MDDLTARRNSNAAGAAVGEFTRKVSKLTMDVVLATCPGISVRDALSQCAVLLRMVAEECDKEAGVTA